MSPWPGSPRPCEIEVQTNGTPPSSRRRGNHGEVSHFGDHLRRKHPDHIRILLHNPRGIKFTSDFRSIHSLKAEKLKKLVLLHDIDLVALSEVNRDWRSVHESDSIWSSTSNWREHRRVQVSYNITKRPTKSNFQVGGTAMVAFDELVFRISD